MRASIAVKEPNFKVFEEFKDTSYAKRYEILIDKLVRENLYSAGALLLSSEKEGLQGKYTEPNSALNMRKFLGGMAGHVMGYLAGQTKNEKSQAQNVPGAH
jgi:type II restriction enzyme